MTNTCHYQVTCFYPFFAFETYLLHGWFGPGMYFGLPAFFGFGSCCLFPVSAKAQSLPSNTATCFPGPDDVYANDDLRRDPDDDSTPGRTCSRLICVALGKGVSNVVALCVLHFLSLGNGGHFFTGLISVSNELTDLTIGIRKIPPSLFLKRIDQFGDEIRFLHMGKVVFPAFFATEG